LSNAGYLFELVLLSELATAGMLQLRQSAALKRLRHRQAAAWAQLY
jgi:hypothetical protein